MRCDILRGEDVLDTFHVLDNVVADVVICRETSRFFASLTALSWSEYIAAIDGIVITVDGQLYGDSGPFFVAQEQYEGFKERMSLI